MFPSEITSKSSSVLLLYSGSFILETMSCILYFIMNDYSKIYLP